MERRLQYVSPAEISLDPESRYLIVAQAGPTFYGEIRGIGFCRGVAETPISGPLLCLPGLLHLVHVFPWEDGATVRWPGLGEDPIAYVEQPDPAPEQPEPKRKRRGAW